MRVIVTVPPLAPDHVPFLRVPARDSYPMLATVPVLPARVDPVSPSVCPFPRAVLLRAALVPDFYTTFPVAVWAGLVYP